MRNKNSSVLCASCDAQRDESKGERQARLCSVCSGLSLLAGLPGCRVSLSSGLATSVLGSSLCSVVHSTDGWLLKHQQQARAKSVCFFCLHLVRMMCQGGDSFPRGHRVLYSSGFPLYIAFEWIWGIPNPSVFKEKLSQLQQ